MAFLNKLFSAGLRTGINETKSEQQQPQQQLFDFNPERLRIVVFRECDFRGRKLLFDSKSIERISLDESFTSTLNMGSGTCAAANGTSTPNGRNGALKCSKGDRISELSEMIYGSVGMSYRGTVYKMHSLENPPAIVCSQVFPSPSSPSKGSAPCQIRNEKNFSESPFCSLRLEDSGASCGSSDQSVLSTASDTVLVCKRLQTKPLDVPVMNASSISSGFGCADYSYSSSSSGPQSIPIDLSFDNSIKLRGTTLKQSAVSLSLENYPRGNKTRIGLAIIVQLSNDDERFEHFLLDHAALLDSLLWRVRRGVETAYIRRTSFACHLIELTKLSGVWLKDFLSTTRLSNNLWFSLNCDDNHPSITNETGVGGVGGIFNFKFLKRDESTTEKFIRELCEVIERNDVKNTNFFISTLLTAVLTHHLGWTVGKQSENPLWQQFSELYGLIGYPAKMSHTIVTGLKGDLIVRVLNILTYFIRCGEVKRTAFNRIDVEEENRNAAHKLFKNIPRDDKKTETAGLHKSKTTKLTSLNVEPFPSEQVKYPSEKVRFMLGDEEITKVKPKYTGIKFNFQQHPQIFKSYLQSKNLELSSMNFANKEAMLNLADSFEPPECSSSFGAESESLQTPSNASELLDFTEELQMEKHACVKYHDEEENVEFIRKSVPNTLLKEATFQSVQLPMPKSLKVEVSTSKEVSYPMSLLRGLQDHYISDLVLQGITAPKNTWEGFLKRDLVLEARRSFTNQPIEESVAIVANTDTWQVQLISSHTYVIDKTSGIPVGMSQLVANMLESLLQMWRLHTPAEYCLLHIEQRLQEFCSRSKALSKLLLATEFCSMETLISSLRLEVNDVPLLMAIASTHSPQLAEKYGLSFQ